jgi:hypothetical protein
MYRTMNYLISFTLTLILVLACGAGAADPTWEYIYEGDILPDDASLADKAWQLMGDNQFAEVTDRGELHIDDIGQNHCFFLYNVRDTGLMQQATIEARVRVLSQSGSANFEVLVGMQDGSNSKWLDLFPDHILLDSSSSTYDIDMTEYHVLRMVRDSANIRIYVDDEEVMNQDHVGAGESWIGFIFGAGCTLCTSEQYWDYVVFTTEGGYSPDELPSYASTRGNPGSAYGPKPANGSLYSDTWVNLNWRPGPFAVSHDVYIGENFEDVNNGTGDTFRGNSSMPYFVVGFPGYPYPDGLIPGTTYYWRIDEVNEADPNSPWKGNVWSFTVPPKTAYDPVPADGAEFVGLDTVLNWTAGFGGKLHTIYIGTDFDDVKDASEGISQGPTKYTPDQLEPGKVYYWRVDEYDGYATYKGDVWSFTTPGAVGNPMPANGATDVKMTATLNWTAAENAVSHEIFFGTDKDAVRNADKNSPEYKGSKAPGTESYDPGKLSLNATFYWRIDEVDSLGNTQKGPLWSFTTADFISIDDFEDYNAGENQIWYSWQDGLGYGTPDTPPYYAGNGTGSAVGDEATPSYCEEKIVHGGKKSMPVAYDNNKQGYAYYSEVDKTLSYPRNWTDEGVNQLSLWFRGVSSNDTEPLYVAVANSTGTPVVVVNNNPAAAKVATWTQWVIPLQTFAEKGIDLTDVDKLMIGLGTKGNFTTPGGSGKIYFDDIQLSRSIEPAE